jgi:hypothetical protein
MLWLPTNTMGPCLHRTQKGQEIKIVSAFRSVGRWETSEYRKERRKDTNVIDGTLHMVQAGGQVGLSADSIQHRVLLASVMTLGPIGTRGEYTSHG